MPFKDQYRRRLHGNGRGAHFPRTDDERRTARDFRVIARHGVRVVRLLSGGLACYLYKQDVLLRRQSDSRLHLHLARLRGGFCRAAVRRDCVRASRRYGRAQVHVPCNHRDHGSFHVRGRAAAWVRHDRDCRTCSLHRDAAAARARARRGIRRSGNLRGRTCARQQARRVDSVDPDHGYAWAFHLADRDLAGTEFRR
jgi:hypothetical protein